MCSFYINIYPILFELWNFFNSQFVAACAGAFAGAYGAYIIAEKSKKIEEIRNLNSAISLAFDICNEYILFKRDFIIPLKVHFDNVQKKYANYQTGNSEDFKLSLDGQLFEPVYVPTKELHEIIANKITLGARPLAAMQSLIRVSSSLDNLVTRRNDLMISFKPYVHINKNMEELYLGQPNENGITDRTYVDIIHHIYEYTNHCIFFSYILCKDMVKQGKSQKNSFLMTLPTIREPDFTKPIESKLMPDEKEYKTWLDGFIELETKNKYDY